MEFEEIQRHQWAASGRSATLNQILQRPFAGVINDSGIDVLKSLEAARGEYKTIDLTNKLVFWTDASHQRQHGTGIAFVWKEKHYETTWKSKQYYVEGAFGSFEGETFAISEAIKVATQLCRDSVSLPAEDDARISTVYVYSDALQNLIWIRDFHLKNINQQGRFKRHTELARLKERALILTQELGVRLELHWVKGHSRIEGNQLADRLAGRAAFGPDDETEIEVLVPSPDGQIALVRGKSTSTGKKSKKRMSRSMKRTSVSAPNLEVDGFEIVSNPAQEISLVPNVRRSDRISKQITQSAKPHERRQKMDRFKDLLLLD